LTSWVYSGIFFDNNRLLTLFWSIVGSSALGDSKSPGLRFQSQVESYPVQVLLLGLLNLSTVEL